MCRKVLTLLSAFLLAALPAGCSPALLVGPTATAHPSATPYPTETPDPCSPGEIERYLSAIRDVSRRFDDAVALAGSTPRASLPPIIADLQEIRRDAEDLQVPMCAHNAKDALVAAMDATIDGFIAFLGQKPDGAIALAFEEAKQLMAEYLLEMLALTDPAGHPEREATATAEATLESGATAAARQATSAIVHETSTAAVRETATALAVELGALDSNWGPSSTCGNGRQLGIGCNAEVVAGIGMMGVGLREGPGLIHERSAVLRKGQVLRVLAGPEEDYAYAWWHLGLPNGQQGWCPENAIVPLDR